MDELFKIYRRYISSEVWRTGECLILHENTIPKYKRLKIPNFFDLKNNCHKCIQLFNFFYSDESGIFSFI